MGSLDRLYSGNESTLIPVLPGACGGLFGSGTYRRIERHRAGGPANG
jgi:hypothetical protein